MKRTERPILRRWTRHEYGRLIDHGFLDEDDPVRDYVLSHPTEPVLVVEVAQSGLRLARGRKAVAYARAGIPDYWIVNLVDHVLEVHREPTRPGPARRRWGYAAIETLATGDAIAPLAMPLATIRVADLLP